MIANWIRRLIAPRTDAWTGCIDFGTAYSKVAMVAAKPRKELKAGDIRPLPIGRHDSLNPLLLPSVVFVTAEEVLFGGPAERTAQRAEREGRSAFLSPKQYLSTHEPEDLDGKLDLQIDPTQSYTPRDLITLYLGYVIKRAELAAKETQLPWPPKLRIARPAWDSQRAEWGEAELRKLVRHAFIVLDRIDDQLIARGRLDHETIKRVMSAMPETAGFPDEQIFAIEQAKATVTEATAVAAGSIRATGRRIVVVADIGGGTSDFAAFMTGLPGQDVLAEIRGSSAVLRQAGDHLDMHLRRMLLDQAGLLPDDTAARGPSNSLRARQRSLKESLFLEGRISVEVGDTFVEMTTEQFLNDNKVRDFSERLRDKFYVAVDHAIGCAQQYGAHSPIEIMPTGGGHSLPMVQSMIDTINRDWNFKIVTPDLVQWQDEDFERAKRQVAVSVGGAMKDLPRLTAAIQVPR
jgi:molecular chaperone DnaK (HSP70)